VSALASEWQRTVASGCSTHPSSLSRDMQNPKFPTPGKMILSACSFVARVADAWQAVVVSTCMAM